MLTMNNPINYLIFYDVVGDMLPSKVYFIMKYRNRKDLKFKSLRVFIGVCGGRGTPGCLIIRSVRLSS